MHNCGGERLSHGDMSSRPELRDFDIDETTLPQADRYCEDFMLI